MKGFLYTVMGGDIFDFAKNRFIRHIYLLCLVSLIAVPFYLNIVVKPSFEAETIKILEGFSVDSAKHINSTFDAAEALKTGNINVQKYDTLIEEFKVDFSLIKVKIFDEEGYCVYSTTKEEISKSKKNTKPYFLNDVKSGKTYTKIVPKNTESKEGKIVSIKSDTLETYYPIMDNGRFLGAVEVYYDITEYTTELKKEAYFLMASMSAVFGPFVIIFIFLIFRESKNLRMHEEREILLKKEHTKRMAIENSVMMGIITLNPYCRITYANPAFTFMTGYSQEELGEMKLPFAFFPENNKDVLTDVFRKIAEGDIPPSGFESRFESKNGWKFIAKYLPVPIRDENDNLIEWVMSFNDITDYHELLAEKEVLSERLEHQVQMMELLRTCKDLNTSYRIVSRYMSLIFPDLDGAIAIVNHPSGAMRIIEHWGDIEISGASTHCDDCFALRTNKPQHVCEPTDHLCKGIMINHKGSPYICIPLKSGDQSIGIIYFQSKQNSFITLNQQKDFIISISEGLSNSLSNILLNEKLRQQAIKDRLTGLYNRHFMDEIFHKEFERAKRNLGPLSVMMIDIDHFKRVNDTHGHACGDFVLSSLGSILLNKFRDADTVCRYGGEEILILMPGCDTECAIAKAEKLRKFIETRELSCNDEKIMITISIGISEYTSDDTNWESFVERADKALYEAKQTGRNKVCIN